LRDEVQALVRDRSSDAHAGADALRSGNSLREAALSMARLDDSSR
jgi:hypothetical protein